MRVLYGLGGVCSVLVSRRWKRRPMAARGSAVEAEHELGEVGVELFVVDAALVGSEQPALERRRDPVAGGQLAVRGLAVARLVEADLLVPVAGGGGAVVAVPAVGLKDRLAERSFSSGKLGATWRCTNPVSVSALTSTIRSSREPARFSVYRWVVRCCRGCGLRSGCVGRPLRSSSCNRSSMRFWRVGSRARSVAVRRRRWGSVLVF
jgi:hypothetical protein